LVDVVGNTASDLVSWAGGIVFDTAGSVAYTAFNPSSMGNEVIYPNPEQIAEWQFTSESPVNQPMDVMQADNTIDQIDQATGGTLSAIGNVFNAVFGNPSSNECSN
jgi:hypothetical protein